jgi:hypothetical protein
MSLAINCGAGGGARLALVGKAAFFGFVFVEL